MLSRIIQLVGAFVLLLLAEPVSAAEGVPARIEYRPAEGCPSREFLLAELTRAGDTLRPSDTATGLAEFAVELQAGVYAGRSKLELEGRRLGTRRVRGSDCAAVVRALAISASLSAEAATEPSEPTAAATEIKVDPRPRALPSPAPPKAAPAPLSASLHAEAGTLVTIANVWLSAVAASTRLQTKPIRIRLGPMYAWGESDAASTRSRFALLAMVPEVCGYVTLASWATLDGCALFHVGLLSARGTSDSNLREALRSWLAPGAAARISIIPFEPFELGLGALVLMPLTRRDFIYEEPKRTVAETQRIGFGSFLSFGFRL